MTDNAPFPVTILRIPNPFFEGRNRVYVIHSDPITIIDTGVATERAQDELRTALRQHDIAVTDIGRIILTHKHIDHIGSAWWIQQESNAEILIHEDETSSISDVDPEGHRWRSILRDRFTTWGVPESARPSEDSASGISWNIQSAQPTPVSGGETIDLGGARLDVIHTPGHTKGSICLKYGNRLFSGDHVLPDISPNIGGGDLNHSGLLADFLSSLRICEELASEIDEVLPGHGDPFATLGKRCKVLHDHHEERLDQVTDILDQYGPQSIYSVATRMFGEIKDMHVVLGCAEAEAHLENLVDAGKITADANIYTAV
jgi:glyoxylase-like metal-dependent hydrolase (beta-lactamase superfamily II)